MKKDRSRYRERTLYTPGRLLFLKKLGLLDVPRQRVTRIDPKSEEGKKIAAEALKKLTE
jgi:hypothetical protein